MITLHNQIYMDLLQYQPHDYIIKYMEYQTTVAISTESLLASPPTIMSLS